VRKKKKTGTWRWSRRTPAAVGLKCRGANLH